MKPYYDKDGITIYNGDCLKVMRQFEDKSFDLVLTDPPYGLKIEYDGFTDTKENTDILIKTFTPEAIRIAYRTAIFSGIHNIWQYPQADWVMCWFYGTTGSWGKMGYNSWQPILFYGKNNKRYGLDTIKYSKIEKRIKEHPCSKPLGLMELLVNRLSEDTDFILDPFMGSGTTLVAAKKLGRKVVGIEISQKYCDIAIKRLKATQKPML